MFEFIYKDGKLQKGKQLLVGIIFILLTVIGGITYTVSAYAASVIEKQQQEVKDLSNRVVSLESTTPATRKDLSNELKEFSKSQQALYTDLVKQSQKTTELTVKAYSESHQAIVGVLIQRQQELSEAVQDEFEKADARSIETNRQLDVLKDITNKDREAIKTLQQNFNSTLAQSKKETEKLTELILELSKKIEKEN